ncbi:hypothetical protein Tco_0464614 [Tanacetum coccineum]
MAAVRQNFTFPCWDFNVFPASEVPAGRTSVVPAGLLTVSSASIIVQDSRDGEYTFKGKLIVDILNHLHASLEGKLIRVAKTPNRMITRKGGRRFTMCSLLLSSSKYVPMVFIQKKSGTKTLIPDGVWFMWCAHGCLIFIMESMDLIRLLEVCSWLYDVYEEAAGVIDIGVGGMIIEVKGKLSPKEDFVSFMEMNTNHNFRGSFGYDEFIHDFFIDLLVFELKQQDMDVNSMEVISYSHNIEDITDLNVCTAHTYFGTTYGLISAAKIIFSIALTRFLVLPVVV